MKLTNQQILDKFQLNENQFEEYKWDLHMLRRQHNLNKTACKFDIKCIHQYHTEELFNFCWKRV